MVAVSSVGRSRIAVCALALFAACASNDPNQPISALDGGIGGSVAGGSHGSGGALGSSGTGGESRAGARFGGAGGSANRPIPIDASASADARTDVHGSCDAAALPPLDSGESSETGPLTEACLACQRARCPCEILRGGDPAVAACVSDCYHTIAALIGGSLASQFCLQGYIPGRQGGFGNPNPTPQQNLCGGPAVVRAPANFDLIVCAAYCPCPVPVREG